MELKIGKIKFIFGSIIEGHRIFGIYFYPYFLGASKHKKDT